MSLVNTSYGLSRNIMDFYDILSKLCEDKKVRVTINESVKGAAIAGASTLLGGLLLGPIGLAIGGIIGGTGAALSSNKFKSVVTVIQEMTREQKRELFNMVMEAVKRINITDVCVLLVALKCEASVQQLVLTETSKFLKDKMDLKLTF